MNTVIFASSTIDEESYREFISANDKTDQQAQKFNRSVLAGFQKNNCKTYAISHRKAEKRIDNKDSINGIKYLYIACDNRPFKRIRTMLLSFITTFRIIKRTENPIVFADGLNVFICLGTVWAARLLHCKSIAFVTDVPGIYNSGMMAKVNQFTLNQFNGYVLITQKMNQIVNKNSKPYIVMEGMYSEMSIDDKMEVSNFAEIEGRKRLLYAGILDEKYGIKSLVDSMAFLDDSYELNLFGSGDCEQYIKDKSIEDERIVYWGICDNSVVMNTEKRMDLLINPRSKEETFTQYSFPSKTIEYMSTGIPVLMQELPGMPEEYKKYLYLYEGDTPIALSNAIGEVFNLKKEIRESKGNDAKLFIVNNKDEISQVEKVLNYFT